VMPYDMEFSHSGEAKLLLTAIHCLLYFTFTWPLDRKDTADG